VIVIVRIDQSQSNVRRIINCDWSSLLTATTIYDYVYTIVEKSLKIS